MKNPLSSKLNQAIAPITKLHFLLIVCLLMVGADCSIRTMIGRSGIQTTVVSPGAPRGATKTTVNASAWTKNGSWIWAGPNFNYAQCLMNITVREDFIVKCPDEKIRLIIAADNRYNYTLESFTGSGNDYTKPDTYDMDFGHTLICNQVYSLYVNAANSGSNCIANPANLAYQINQKDCTCDVVGSYYDWHTCGCQTCLSKIPGCMTCNAPDSVSIVCTSCATSKRWVLFNNACVCLVGYVTIPGCLNCFLIGGTCPACDTSINFQLSSGSCVCSSGYALVGSNCQTCSSLLSNCVTCSSSTTCLSCLNTTYAVSGGTCQTCTSLIANCLTCTSSSVCVSCVSTSYALVGSACQPCSTPIVGCLTCSSSTMCTVCNAAGSFQKSGSKCTCMSGYTLTGTTCSTCASQMVGCDVCTSTSVCTSCNTGGNFEANGANGCRCKSGFLLVAASCQTCSSFMPGCSSCTTQTTCTTCDSALNLVPGATGCVCASRYGADGSGVCVACTTIDSNCLTCSDSTTCTDCTLGYGVSGAGTACASCSAIHPACQDCTGSTCTLCDSALSFTADATLGCVCISPTSLPDGLGGCVLCSTIPGCLQCTPLYTCSLCQTGYYLNGLLSCSACDTGCDICTGPGACTQCDSHYSFSAGFCVLCGVSVQGCATCTAAGVCLTCDSTQHLVLNGAICECETGYYNNSGTCTLCSSGMPGCTSCAVSNYCDTCDATLFMTVSSGSCVCIPDYALDPVNCQPCSTLITDCQTCTSSTSCTTCNSLYGVVLTMPSAGSCSLCSTMITGCSMCTDENTCTVCAVGYALDGSGGCQLCSVTLTGCSECTDISTCTLCSSNTQAPNSIGICTNCPTLMPGCLTCTSDTVCTSCDTANNFDFSNTACGCVSPYLFKTSTSSCETCLTLQPLCDVCQTETYCLDCKDGAYLSGTVGSQTCVTCPNGCLTCDSNTNCFTCDAVGKYVFVGTLCYCQVGYSLSGGVCAAVCGDGLVAVEEGCDDGNTVSGDGCDSTCHVEPDFSCYSFPGDPSTCSYNKPLTISLNNVTKVPGQNSLTLNLNIGPMLPNLTNINFSSILSANLPLSNPQITLNPDGTLSITYDYNSTIDGQNLQLTIAPAGADQSFFAVPPSNIVIPLNSSDNLPLTYYNESTYEKEQQYDKAYKAGVGVTYGVLGIGLLCDKVNGVELFGVWQVAFLSLSTINHVQPLLAPLMKLGIVNGVNSMVDFDSAAVPNRVSAIGYAAEFLQNVNYMLVLVLADVLIGGVLYLVASLIPKYKEKLQNIGLRMLKEYFLMLVLFNSFNFAYSAGLQFTYCQKLFSLNTAVAVLTLLFPLTAAIAVTTTDPKQFGEFKNHYRPDTMSQLYFVCTIAYRTALGACMSQMNEVQQATIVNFFLGIVFMMYLMTNTPYVKGYHNYRAMFDQAAILSSLFVAMFYRSMKSTTDVAITTQILDPAMLSIGTLYASVGVSVVCLAYELYLKFRKQDAKPQSLGDALPNQQQDTMEGIQDENHMDSAIAIENVFNND